MPTKSLRIAMFTAVVLFALPGAASAKARVSISIPSGLDAGTPTPFTYVTSGVRGSTKVVLQRRMGGRGVWRTVVGLSRVGSGSGILPSLAIGRYQVRIAAISRKRALAQKAKTVFVYGEVPLESIFGRSESGVYTTLDGTFPFAEEFPGYGTMFTISPNPCRSVRITFIPGANSGTWIPEGQPGNASIVQQSLDPVTATGIWQRQGEIKARLVPGEPWSMNSDGDESYTVRWYVNGSASCYQAKVNYEF